MQEAILQRCWGEIEEKIRSLGIDEVWFSPYPFWDEEIDEENQEQLTLIIKTTNPNMFISPEDIQNSEIRQRKEADILNKIEGFKKFIQQKTNFNGTIHVENERSLRSLQTDPYASQEMKDRSKRVLDSAKKPGVPPHSPQSSSRLFGSFPLSSEIMRDLQALSQKVLANKINPSIVLEALAKLMCPPQVATESEGLDNKPLGNSATTPSTQ